jgi:hypothetical protein
VELSQEDVPSDLPKFEILVNNLVEFDGYIFIRKLEDPGRTFMINDEGKVVWYQSSDTTILRVFKPYEDSYLSMRSAKELHEISYRGDTLTKLKYGEGGFDRALHHEVIKDSQDRYVGLTREVMPYDLTRFGGNENDTLITDGILVLSKEGQKIWHWSFDKVLDTIQNVDVDIFQIRNDWAHANALYEDIDGNYVVSWRDLNQVWKINSQSGDIVWIYGAETIENENERFKSQHGIHQNLDGDYMLFDNGPNRAHFSSRAVAFNFNEDKLENSLIIDLPDSIFTNKQGSVYQYKEDRFLYSVTRTNDLIITNRKGDVLWHAKSDIGFYRAYFLEKAVLR